MTNEEFKKTEEYKISLLKLKEFLLSIDSIGDCQNIIDKIDIIFKIDENGTHNIISLEEMIIDEEELNKIMK